MDLGFTALGHVHYIRIKSMATYRATNWSQEQLHPRGRGEVIVYCDYDGALHHHNVLWKPKVGPYLAAPEGYRLFQHVGLLEELLAPYPQVKLVLSTSWVVRYGLWKASKRLTPALRERCIDGTYHYGLKGNAWLELPRGVQVSRDAERRQPKGWLALDDSADGWPDETRDNLIHTDACEGIGPAEIQQAIRQKLALLVALP
jgi:hypothetical protein